MVTSLVVAVRNQRDDTFGVSITTKSGTVYQLEGPPRPSFDKHCKAMGIDFRHPDAVRQLVERLKNPAPEPDPEPDPEPEECKCCGTFHGMERNCRTSDLDDCSPGYMRSDRYQL